MPSSLDRTGDRHHMTDGDEIKTKKGTKPCMQAKAVGTKWQRLLGERTRYLPPPEQSVPGVQGATPLMPAYVTS